MTAVFAPGSIKQSGASSWHNVIRTRYTQE